MTARFCAAILGIAAASLVLAACASGAGGVGKVGAQGDTGGARWIVGTWGDTAPEQPYLEFSDDDSVTGSDGCNRISTSYSVEGDTVTFARILSTLKGCVGVDSWLTKARTAVVNGEELIVRDGSGTEIGTLTRADD